ncbi:MAG: tetratricopeptide repeat protein [Acidobacteriota bacterium]
MRRISFAGIVLLISSSLLMAQTWRGKGRLEGTVTDSQGKPVVGAVVKLQNVSKGGSFELKTDEKGNWVAGGIASGVWYIDVGAQGYRLRQLSAQVSEVTRGKPVVVTLEPDPLAVAGALDEAKKKELSAQLGKGDALFQEGSYEQALAEYQAILAKYPEVALVNVSVANCYYEMKQPEKAIEALTLALEKNPTSTDVIVRLGNIYAETGNLAKALEYFGKIDEKSITNPVTFYNIGVLLFNNQRIPEAKGYFEKSITLDPSFADGYYQLGLCLVNQNDLAKAKEVFNKFLALAPDHPNAPMVQNIMKSL